MPSFHHDGIHFHYVETGEGRPFVFQHGLAADVNQSLELFVPPPGVRLLAFDCRGHGQTQPIGDESKFTFATFADDLAAFLDHLSVDRAVIGGTSMGAAVALNFALRYPQRTHGLVMSRPAWLAGPRPDTVYWCRRVAEYIRRFGVIEGRQHFMQTPEYEDLRRTSPESVGPLLRQFELPRAQEAVARLERIPPDTPCTDLAQVRSLRVPTLVLANHHDPVHPFEYGEILARAIPGAMLREITPKCIDADRHVHDVQRHIEEYLIANFSPPT